MKNDINTKLNQMSATELKEIIDNSFLYDTEIVEKAKELLTEKEKASSQVVENVPTKTPAPSITHKKGFIIAGVSVIVILVALIATVFGIRATNADKYILVEENCDGSLSTYEYEFDFLNRVTKRYTYTDGELFGTSYYNSEGKYKEVIGFEDSDCTTYTLKSQTDDVIEWSFDDGYGTGVMTEKYNSHGDVIEAIQPITDGEIVYKYSYQYDNNGNKTKGVTEIFYNNQKVQHDLESDYTYLTVKEYQNRTTVKGNIELRDCNGRVLLTKADIKKAVAVTDNGSSYVELTFTASGKEKFASATEQISALGYGQNNIQIYLNDELISAPVVTQRVESDTVNIAPLTSEDATNIANAINDGNYTTGNIAYVSNEPNTAPAKELRIFTEAKFEPFEYYSGDDIVGFDIDLINALCNELGYKAVIEDGPFDAVMQGIATEKADCAIAAICVTEERKMSVDFSDIYISCYVDYGEGNIEQDFAIAFPKGSSLIAEFNSAIEEAKADGTIDALVEKYDLDVLDEDKSENNKPVNNMIETAKKGLGVPDNKSITYETSEPFSYVGTNCVEITFYENGELVANGKVNAETGEVLAAIIEYTFDHSKAHESSNGNTTSSTNEYKKTEVAYYYTINAKAIPKSDGSYTFYHICPYCHEETPALSAVKNRKVKCRFSGCTGRTAGYTYTIEAIYN